MTTTVEGDGFVGYVFRLADGNGGCLVVQRADDPEPHEEPYCLVWGRQEGTTYGGVDVTPPDFSFSVIWSYVADMQFVLLVLAIAWTALILRWRRGNGIRQVALVTAGNLVVNLAFFLSHPVFTPYYTIPVGMLSLWSVLFALLMPPAEIVDDDLAGQAVKARS